MIALSLSRILNRGDAYFAGNYDQLSNLLNEFMAVHRSEWRSVDFHVRNIAVFFYAHTPANWGEGLYRLSAIRIMEAFGNYGQHHRNLESDLANLYGSSSVL